MHPNLKKHPFVTSDASVSKFFKEQHNHKMGSDSSPIHTFIEQLVKNKPIT